MHSFNWWYLIKLYVITTDDNKIKAHAGAAFMPWPTQGKDNVAYGTNCVRRHITIYIWFNGVTRFYLEYKSGSVQQVGYTHKIQIS